MPNLAQYRSAAGDFVNNDHEQLCLQLKFFCIYSLKNWNLMVGWLPRQIRRYQFLFLSIRTDHHQINFTLQLYHGETEWSNMWDLQENILWKVLQGCIKAPHNKAMEGQASLLEIADRDIESKNDKLKKQG